MFFGPWVDPGRTACWSCFRRRFDDSLLPDNGEPVEHDPRTIRAVAENVVLAIRHPQRTPFGCVVVEGEETDALHAVLPMPWCELCGGAAELTERGWAPLTQSLLVPEQFRVLADTRGGVVRRLFIFNGDNADAPAVPFTASAQIAAYRQGPVSRPEFTGEGKGATSEAAIRSAIGEGVERYSASLWDPSKITRASLRDLDGGAFDPRWLVLYDELQYLRKGFPFAPFDPEADLDWTRGVWLDTGEAVQLPALATYMHYPAEPAEQFAQITSNGLAAGSTLEDATLRALYELIERDAFMLFWLAGLPGRRFAEDRFDPVTQQALAEVERLGARTELYLLDAGTGYPTIVCVGLGDGRSWPGVTIGLAADADVAVALQRAVLEHGHYGTYIRRLMLDGRHLTISSSEQVVHALDHALYYIPPARARALAQLRSGTEPPATVAQLRPCYQQKSTLAGCVAALGSAGIRAAAADVTSPDVALAPISVVRAFGTYMQPIQFGAANRRLNSPRLAALLTRPPVTEPPPLA